MSGNQKRRQMVIPVASSSEGQFGGLQLRWMRKHPRVQDPDNVVLANPDFFTVRHVIVCKKDITDEPASPLWDQSQIDDQPGTVTVPWFILDDRICLVMVEEERAVRGVMSRQFPQGYCRGRSPVDTAIAKIQEELGLSTKILQTEELLPVCPVVDWCTGDDSVVLVRIAALEEREGLFFIDVRDLSQSNAVLSGTNLGPYLRALAQFQAKGRLQLISD